MFLLIDTFLRISKLSQLESKQAKMMHAMKFYRLQWIVNVYHAVKWIQEQSICLLFDKL